jgi:transposase-like protein
MVENVICPNCGSNDISKFGFLDTRQKYLCKNKECIRQTFITEYKKLGWKRKYLEKERSSNGKL